MSKILGVDTSTIDNISGLGVGGGGISAVPVTTDTGIVLCPVNSSLGKPFSENELSAYDNPTHMYQVSDITTVVQMSYNAYAYGALKSNGDFYVGGWANASYMGMSSSDAASVVADGGMKLSLSGAVKIESHQYGFFAIKTDGTLWWCGQVSSYLNSAALGGGSTVSSNGWTQIGSDTDWHDIVTYINWPSSAMAIKGASGSRYLYATGYGTNYATGQGSTSTLYNWTRVKSSSGTDLNESMSVVKTSYGSSLAVSDSGKLFSWGENGYGGLGQGNTTDKPYATQVGVATNWDDCWVSRFVGLAKNTSGEMYMSTRLSSFRIEPSTDKTFTKIGTDTDYQDIRLYHKTTSSLDYTVFVKKGGSWFVSHDGVTAGRWAGSTAAAATSQGTWVALNTVLQDNDITGTVDDIMPFESSNANSAAAVMFALSP